jgi:transposase/very-short-patch-repair endonuclease
MTIENELRNLYYKDRLTISDIAKKYNTSKSTIQRRFKKYNIPINKSFLEDETVILDAYKEGISVDEISKKYTLSKSFINKKLREFGIDKKHKTNPKLKDKSWLQSKLLDEHLLQTEIAQELNVSESAVLWWKNKHKIPSSKRFNVKEFHNKEYLIKLYDKYPIEQIAKLYECDITTVSNAMEYHGIDRDVWKYKSSLEEKINQLLLTLDVKFIRNATHDFYFPDHNLAIECNGVYWHSEKFKNKSYHANKYDECLTKGIRLLQFWECDIQHKFQQVTAIIKNALGITTERIFARKCIISPISKKESKEFLDGYHIQGAGHSSIELALKYNDKFVAVMTFKKRDSSNYELTRYATSNNVVGGFTRNYSFDSIVTFSDNMIFSGNVYKKCGFVLDKHIFSDYKYLYNDRLIHKFNLRYKKKQAGYLKVFDAGKKRWKLT